MTVTVSDNPAKHRFEVRVAGELAGHAEYERSASVLRLTHTVVKDEFEGHGLAARLARAAFASARESGLDVLPQCDYMAHYAARHPGLVPGA